VSKTQSPQPAIRVIRFSRRLARQCGLPGVSLPDWVVCDTIANGSRSPYGRPGPGGGPLVRFEKTFRLRGAGRPSPTVRVLGELTRGGCVALRLASPVIAAGKIWAKSGFLNRPHSK
jgi:hypothetical protein